MVLVSPSVLKKKIEGKPLLEQMLKLLEKSVEVQSYLTMANVMAVQRLLYNDHGPVHSRIVAGAALEILDILLDNDFIPSIVRDGVGGVEDARLVVMVGAYLHDIGNAVHRSYHHLTGTVLASRFLPNLLEQVYRDKSKVYRLTPEILHCILSHDEKVRALSLEAGIVKVADGVDMAEGRARMPYRQGKYDIHALSALAIRRVEIEESRSRERPVKIVVDMDNEAGVFQIEEVLGRKIVTSSIANLVEIEVLKKGEPLKVMRFQPHFT